MRRLNIFAYNIPGAWTAFYNCFGVSDLSNIKNPSELDIAVVNDEIYCCVKQRLTNKTETTLKWVNLVKVNLSKMTFVIKNVKVLYDNLDALLDKYSRSNIELLSERIPGQFYISYGSIKVYLKSEWMKVLAYSFDELSDDLPVEDPEQITGNIKKEDILKIIDEYIEDSDLVMINHDTLETESNNLDNIIYNIRLHFNPLD